MDTLIKVGQLIAALAILVTIHELGHFWAARMFGIRVEKFYLFFDAWGFKLFKFKKGDTEYGIGWLPLGGYVKISGMIDESMDTDQLKSEPQPWEFRSKPAWQRLIVMLGGIIMNVVLGMLIFIVFTFVKGESYIDNSRLEQGIVPFSLGKEIGLKEGDRILKINGKELVKFEDIFSSKNLLNDNNVYTVQRGDSMFDLVLPHDFLNKFIKSKGDFLDARIRFYIKQVQNGSNAKAAGLQNNDTIIALNDTAVEFFNDFQQMLKNHAGGQVTLTVNRQGKTETMKCNVEEDGTIGFQVGAYGTEKIVERFGFFESIPRGIKKSVQTLVDQAKGFSLLFTGKVDPSRAVQGPIGMVQFFPAHWDWSIFWTMCALLSLVLAFMNLLPIPALDGGHVVFLLVEIVRGKPLSDKFLTVMQVIGMVILLSLMVLVFGNDIFQALRK